MFEYFYHETLRRTIVTFGTLFNNLQIKKTDNNGNVVEVVKVPLAYGPTQKFLSRLVVPNPEVGWYSYDAKYLMTEGAKVVIPAPLPQEKLRELKHFALEVFKALECSGLARIDFFVEHHTQKVFLNEVNTMPGFTPISMYPKMWQASGKAYSDLLTEVIGFARMEK